MKFATALLSISVFFFAITPGQSFGDEENARKIESLYAEFQRQFPTVQTVSADEVEKLKNRKRTVIVDVRTPKERAVSFIPASISQSDFESNLAKYEGGTIIAYCTIGYRSAQFAQTLAKKGIEVHNLKGGILSWINSGFPLVDQVGPTRKVHVYGRKWNIVPSGYQAKW